MTTSSSCMNWMFEANAECASEGDPLYPSESIISIDEFSSDVVAFDASRLDKWPALSEKKVDAMSNWNGKNYSMYLVIKANTAKTKYKRIKIPFS